MVAEGEQLSRKKRQALKKAIRQARGARDRVEASLPAA